MFRFTVKGSILAAFPAATPTDLALMRQAAAPPCMKTHVVTGLGLGNSPFTKVAFLLGPIRCVQCVTRILQPIRVKA